MLKSRKWLFIFVAISSLSFAALSYFFWPFYHKPKLWFQIPIHFFKPSVPCMGIEIEGNKYLCELDSGANFYFSLKKEVIDKIKGKKPNVGVRNSLDIKGNKYVRPVSSVDLIKIEKMWFKNVSVVEESMEFLREGSILDPPICRELDETLSHISGRVGMAFLLGNPYWLIDFPNSSLYPIRDLSQFEKSAKISLANFVKVPLELGSTSLIFVIDTDFGKKNFTLDTGASHSVIRSEEGGLSLYTTEKFEIGGHDFGPTGLGQYKIDPSFEFDGVLGVDFLRKHAVYLDFKQMKAYIAPQEQPPLPAKG